MTIVLDGSSGITAPGGTAAAPSITTTGDVNTGIFFPAADTIAFSEGGTESLRINSSGNLGLGVTPSAWNASFKAIEVGAVGNSIFSPTSGGNTLLTNNAYYDATGNWIYARTAAATHYEQISGAHKWLNAASGTAGNAISFTQAMTLDASSNLSVGTTSNLLSASGRLTVSVNGSSSSALAFGVGGTRYGHIYCDTVELAIANGAGASGYIDFQTNGAERARFNATGAFVFAGGTTTADGIGITFPASQSASSNANTLDDYEEGSWTPVLSGDSGASGSTYSTQVGKYVKIGSQVICWFDITLTVKGTLSGGVVGITNNPFTPAANTGGTGVIDFDNLATNWIFVGCQAGGFSYLRGKNSAGTGSQYMAPADIANNTRLTGSFYYRV